VEFKLKSVKSVLPVRVSYRRDGTEYTTMAYVDYAFDSVEIPDQRVFEGIEDGRIIEDFKRAILKEMDYDPGNIPAAAIPAAAWAEIDKVKAGEYKSIFKNQYGGFGPGPGPGPGPDLAGEEEDGV